MPSGKTFRYEYNDCKELKTIIMPSGTRHELPTKYHYHTTDRLYENGFSNNSYTWEYSPDIELVNRTDPQGYAISYTYDESYRMTSMNYGNHVIVFGYVGGFDEPQNIRRYTDQILVSEIQHTFDGSLPLHASVSHNMDTDVDAEFSYEYSSGMWLNEIKAAVLDSEYTSLINRNEAGHIIKYDNFEFSRRSDSNVEMSDGVIECIYKHDKVGLLSAYTCNIGGSDIFDYSLTKDSNSTVIIHRSIKIATRSVVNYDYTFDEDGQLIEVVKDGETKETYSYDLNGNRASWNSYSESHVATYDMEDKITHVDDETYSHSANGFLASAGNGNTFSYNPKGELEQAMVDNMIITYRYDGLSRLISRTTADDTVQLFYGDPQNPLQPSHIAKNGLVSALFYNSRGMLIAIKDTVESYYVMCDHLGTPLAVFDSHGSIMKEMTYDSYGVLLSDTNPTFFMPIGYTGGIYDTDTKLVHFHFRDYITYLGRWAARDPSFFNSNQPNLYQYVFNDPINLRDPLGLVCFGGTFYGIWGVFGGGGSLCFDKNGLTVCVEGGASTPGWGVSLDPSGKPKDKKGTSFEAGASLEIGNLSFDYNPAKGMPNDPCAWSYKYKVQDGYTNHEFSKDHGKDPAVKKTYSISGGGGKSPIKAKAFVKGCHTV